MAFSFANAAAASTGGGPNVQQGPDLELIQTEGLGFLNIAGETKLQFVSKWEQPPIPTASLISIASHKGIVAAAGPDAVHIATTESVRAALKADGPADTDNNIRPFTPQITIPLQLRVSQLAFTADEAYLVISAESGGGLAVYDVQALIQGGGGSAPQAAFELSTSGETLRALSPNPMADRAELCALVTTNGNLLVADLKQRTLKTGANGAVLRSQVSCVAWSSKGKQLVAGCADGSVYQMTPEGQEKAHLPKPPRLGDFYVASIAWLENDVFLVVHNPTNPGDPSAYHIITRNNKAVPVPEIGYQKLNDPVEPFGDKAPHHSILRLRDFPPNLQDLLIVASTAVESIGLLSRSTVALAPTPEAEKITGVFTTTELADDSRRAQLPMGADYNDTYPVGVSLDLSSKDKVYKPIPTDEIEESPGPLPGLWVLNNEGVLVTWWVIYNDSVRQGTTFPGLAAVEGSAQQPSAGAIASPQRAPAFGSTPTASPAPAFGSSAAPAFGSPAPAFGSSAALGTSPSPWGKTPAAAGSTSPTRAGPAFGAPSTLGSGSGFGAPSGLGSKQSVWGAKSTGAPAFGQSSFGSGSGTATESAGGAFSSFANKTSAFSSFADKSSGFSSFATKTEPAAAATSTTTSSPFGAFGSTAQSGFASLGSGSTAFGGSFASKTPASGGGGLFGSDPAKGLEEAKSAFATAFPAPATKTESSSAFGSSPFVLGTTFKAEPRDVDAKPPPVGGGGGSLFGSGFGLSLGQTESKAAPAATPAAAPVVKEEKMDAPTAIEAPPAEEAKPAFESTTPTTTPAPAKYFNFLSDNNQSTTPNPFGSTSGALFGKPGGTTSSSNPFLRAGGFFNSPKSPNNDSRVEELDDDYASDETPKPSRVIAAGEETGTKEKTDDAKKESGAEAAPLPPDTTSKTAYLVGDTSSSSSSSSSPESSAQGSRKQDTKLPPSNNVAEDDAPLPPDPFSSKAKSAEPPLPPDPFAKAKSTEPPLPPDPFSAKAKSAEPPLPPDPFAKPKKADPAAAAAKALPEEAPLPPDPFSKPTTTTQETPKESKPAPSLFGTTSTTPQSNPFGAMKPPGTSGTSIFSSGAKLNVGDAALQNPFANLPKPPLSPTTDGSEDGFSEEGEVEGEEDDEEDEKYDEEEEEEDDDDEGSGTDVAKDLSPSTSGLVQTPSFSTRGSFTTTGIDGSVTSAFSHVEAPAFGERGAPVLPPPRQETSPRSPSPQRPSKSQGDLPGRLFRDDSARSFSAPGMASQLLRDPARQAAGQAPLPKSSQLFGRGSTSVATPTGSGNAFGGQRRAPRDVNLEEQKKAEAAARAAAQAAEEAEKRANEDSYDTFERELEQPLEATRQLAECVYILDSDIDGGDSVASQAEAVYRDIYRMILVLKMNARNIDAFLRGHSESPSSPNKKTEDDLADPEGWVLCDVDDLGAIVSRDLPTKLRQSRVQGQEAILESSEALLKEGGKLQAMHEDLVRVIQVQIESAAAADSRNSSSPSDFSAARSLPLTAEQATQQNDLRRTFTQFMADLVEAEQQLVLLRTRMASVAGTQQHYAGAGNGGTTNGTASNGTASNGHFSNGARSSPVPTVDAVMRTIHKMTSMAEKRSGDIDVLEAQMRKLGLGGGGSSGVGSPSVREGSPASFATPQKQLQHYGHAARGSVSAFTPGSAQRSVYGASTLAAASPAAGTPTRRKLTGYTEKEKDVLRQSRASRQRTLARLQKIQQAEGPRYMPMD